MSSTTQNRFNAKIHKAGPDECWLWKASICTSGYGQFWVEHGRKELAHRYAYELAYGAPAGRVVMHSCDTPRCCNPAHLRAGTQQENLEDMRRKGRQRTGFTVRGVDVHQARFTEADIKRIRRLYAFGVTQVAIGKKYRTRQGVISSICRRETWKHVQ